MYRSKASKKTEPRTVDYRSKSYRNQNYNVQKKNKLVGQPKAPKTKLRSSAPLVTPSRFDQLRTRQRTLAAFRLILSTVCIALGVSAYILQSYLGYTLYSLCSAIFYFTGAVLALISSRLVSSSILIIHAGLTGVCCVAYLALVSLNTFELYCDVGWHCDCKIQAWNAPLAADSCHERWETVPVDLLGIFCNSLMLILNLSAVVCSVNLLKRLRSLEETGVRALVDQSASWGYQVHLWNISLVGMQAENEHEEELPEYYDDDEEEDFSTDYHNYQPIHQAYVMNDLPSASV